MKIKAGLLLIVVFFYFFAGSLLTRILYPFECKGIIPYIVFRGSNYSIIDLNIPHFIAFIIMGFVFKIWAIWFSVISELLQVAIKNNQFSRIDILLNLIGSIIGIFLAKLKFK